jgi:hypothetical protein
MKRWEMLLAYRPLSKKASIAWLVMVICAIGASLLVVIAARAASAHPDHESSHGGWYQRCSLAKTRSFDPIVYPDKPPPVGHRHLFFGSTAISHDSNASDLRAGGTTCRFRKGTVDPPDGGNFSSYWIPDLKLRNGNWAGGARVNTFYTRGALSVNAHDIKPFPAGLKMLIHDRNNRQTQVSWYCSGLPGEGHNGKFAERPYDCNPDGRHPYVTVRIFFPQCGNGHRNSRDHIRHMAYAGARGCPSSHPHEFPRLIIAAKYDTWRGAGSKLAGGKDTATGFHADYFEAWRPRTLEFLLDTCIRGGIVCGDGGRLP